MEEDLVVEKSKIKQVSDDLNAVFDELMWLDEGNHFILEKNKLLYDSYFYSLQNIKADFFFIRATTSSWLDFVLCLEAS